MKFKDLNSLRKGELKNRLEEAEKDIIKLNAQIATGTPPKNPHAKKNLKKIIARIKTVENQKMKIKTKTKTNSKEKIKKEIKEKTYQEKEKNPKKTKKMEVESKK